MAKKVLTWIAVAFVVFYLLTAPAEAASAVRTAFDAVETAGGSLVVFFENLA